MKKYIGMAIVSAFVACTNPSKQGESGTDSVTKADTVTLNTEVQLADPKIEKIYKGYISLKNSLVSSNSAAAKQTAMDLSVALKGFEGCENTALIADKIAGTGDLKIQRKEFTALSSDVIALFKHVELNKGNIYVQHCPMANGGDGGDWLSSDQKIRNPYYGDEMMECGAVLETISSKK